MVEGTGRGKFKERLRRDFHPLPTFRVTDDPFLGSQMTAFAAKFRVTDDRFLGSQMTGEPQIDHVRNREQIFPHHFGSLLFSVPVLWRFLNNSPPLDKKGRSIQCILDFKAWKLQILAILPRLGLEYQPKLV